jgi:hypothetical protein
MDSLKTLQTPAAKNQKKNDQDRGTEMKPQLKISECAVKGPGSNNTWANI